MNPARIRPRIKTIVVNEEHTAGTKIYIDFWDERRPRWYVLYLADSRCFGVAVAIDADGMGTRDLAPKLRSFLISIIPPDIIARCTAASLGVR